MKRKSAVGQVREGLGAIKELLYGIHDLKAEAQKLGLGQPAQPRPYEQLIQRMQKEGPYEALGVERDAPWKMIKEIYLRKAVWYHPDSNLLKGGNEAHFKRISAAFEAIKRERGQK
jgi:hypothetical protein